MANDEPVYVYTSEETKQRIKDRAEAADMSVSDFCEQVLEEHLEETASQSQRARYQPSQRLEVTIEDARRELEAEVERLESAVDEEISDVQSLRAVYAISIWELLKSEYGPSHRKEAMQTAASRVKKDQGGSSADEDTESDSSNGATPPKESGQELDSHQPVNSGEP